MSAVPFFLRGANGRIALVAVLVVLLDQFSKKLVVRLLGYHQEKIIIDGFFKFVHWGNTGAAWSMFSGSNALLALVAIVALVVLYYSRHHFNAHTTLGQIAFGLIFGGIVGNLIDRVFSKHVIDFIYFYLDQRNGNELGFPAFNIADSAICTGVGLIFLITWRNGQHPEPVEEGASPRP